MICWLLNSSFGAFSDFASHAPSARRCDSSHARPRDAEASSRRDVSLYEFSQVVDGSFSPEQKKRVVELLWRVAFSDSEKHALEEHLIRTIAGLLHVSHPEFIDAKIRARTAPEAGSTS